MRVPLVGDPPVLFGRARRDRLNVWQKLVVGVAVSAQNHNPDICPSVAIAFMRPKEALGAGDLIAFQKDGSGIA